MWNFKEYGEKTAIIDDAGNMVSYSELEDFGEEIAQKVGRRCVVFSLCTNTIGSVAGYASFMNHRIVPVMLNAHLETELL